MLSFFALPAHAQLEICNKTAAPFSLAIAYETDTDVVSQGWWTIDPDKCEQVIKTELKHQYYYHYVVSRALGVEWAGTFNFCTNDDPQFRYQRGQLVRAAQLPHHRFPPDQCRNQQGLYARCKHGPAAG